MLIYAGHTPYTYVDAFALTEGQDELAKQILETVFNGSGNDGTRTVEPAPDEPNFGITDEFEVKMDEYGLLTFESEEIDISQLIGNSYSALFNSSLSEETMLIEPACLSNPPNIDFSAIEENIVQLSCGQDASLYNLASLSKEGDRLVFSLVDQFSDQNKLKLEVLPLDSTAENPFGHIEVSLSDFNALYMGYYDDSITSINSNKLMMMLHSKENVSLLKSLDRATAVPCPDDVYDEY